MMNTTQADFRMDEPTITFHNGKAYLIRTCYEMVAGRWEGFVSMVPVKDASRRVQ
jgi:hypothetical protein